jgi:hypothetical protein
MAMAGLGSPAEIWRWPFHYYMAVRAEYLKIVNPGSAEAAPSGDEVRIIAPGITETKYKY